MQTCAETVYEEQEQTFYKTEYSEEKVKVKVPAIEYKEEVAYRCCCVTVMQLPPPGSACGPANGCTTGCESPTCPELVPVQVLQKCPYKVMREVNVTKEVEKTQLVCKTVPYKITVCIPHVVYKQVPVQVCCPTVCCKRCATCQPAAPATSACAPAAPSPTGK